MSGRDGALLLMVAILAVLALPLTAVPIDAPDSDGTEEGEGAEPAQVTVYGYVTNLSNQEQNTPLEHVAVGLYTWSPNGMTPVDSTYTDSDGRFEFTYERSDVPYFLHFEYSGYTVRSLPDLNMTMNDDGYIQFQLRDSMLDGDGNYALTGTADGPHAIVMAITTGQVFGTVQGTYDGDTFRLSGATVTLVAENGQTYTAETDGNGYFQIDCPYGTYTLRVTCNGFQDSDPVAVDSVGSEGATAVTVTLQQNSSETFLGLDTAHAVMVIALILVVVIAVVIAVLYRRSASGGESVVVNDLDEIARQDEEEEEIRRP